MAKKDLNTRIVEIENQRAELEAERKRLLTQQTAQQRKDDTRRKILTGAIVLGDEQLKKAVLPKLSGTLTADRDRKLFGLPVLPKKMDQPGGGTA
jgi:hypothetical protein